MSVSKILTNENHRRCWAEMTPRPQGCDRAGCPAVAVPGLHTLFVGTQAVLDMSELQLCTSSVNTEEHEYPNAQHVDRGHPGGPCAPLQGYWGGWLRTQVYTDCLTQSCSGKAASHPFSGPDSVTPGSPTRGRRLGQRSHLPARTCGRN